MRFWKRKPKSNVPDDIKQELRRRALQSLVYEEQIPANQLQAPPEEEPPKSSPQALHEAWGGVEEKPGDTSHLEAFQDMAEEASARADREGATPLTQKKERKHDHRNWSPYSKGEFVFSSKKEAQLFARAVRRDGNYAKVVKGKDGWVVYVYSRDPSAKSKTPLFKEPKSSQLLKLSAPRLGGTNTLSSLREPTAPILNFSPPNINLRVAEPEIDFNFLDESALRLSISLPKLELDDSFLRQFGGGVGGQKKRRKK